MWLIQRGLSLRALFWATGALAFVVSPIADNLTTALLLGAVVLAVGRGHPRFVTVACINVVIAANAGGAFSPFGDITTLMVWQAGKVEFTEFFALFLPSLVNWLVPAILLSMAIGGGQPEAVAERPRLEPAALIVLGLFLGTIALTVSIHSALDLPPAVGMMAGLAALKAYSYVYNSRHRRRARTGRRARRRVHRTTGQENGPNPESAEGLPVWWSRRSAWRPRVERCRRAAAIGPRPMDVFALLEKIEWDTLMFFYGVLMGVGGSGCARLSRAHRRSSFMAYWDRLPRTCWWGLLSAVIDNVPVMFAVLQMSPEMSHGQWLLVTLTAGVGGSLLSIGSAAGVALMGQARGIYTFGAHLRWVWAIALGIRREHHHAPGRECPLLLTGSGSMSTVALDTEALARFEPR